MDKDTKELVRQMGEYDALQTMVINQRHKIHELELQLESRHASSDDSFINNIDRMISRINKVDRMISRIEGLLGEADEFTVNDEINSEQYLSLPARRPVSNKDCATQCDFERRFSPPAKRPVYCRYCTNIYNKYITNGCATG